MARSLVLMVKGVAQAHEPEQLPRAADKPRRYPEGRRCSCGNRLSVWNGSSHCHACSYERDKYLFVGKVSLRELMEQEG